MSVSARGSSSTARIASPELIARTPDGGRRTPWTSNDALSCHPPRRREAPRDPQALAGLAGRVGPVELEVEARRSRARSATRTCPVCSPIQRLSASLSGAWISPAPTGVEGSSLTVGSSTSIRPGKRACSRRR